MTSGNIRRKKPKSKPKSTSGGQDPVFQRSRKRLAEKRNLRRFETQWAHFWNLCPKCGGDMFEQKSLDIYFEVCRDCFGIYIDTAELDLARKHLDPKKFLLAISRRAKKPKLPP